MKGYLVNFPNNPFRNDLFKELQKAEAFIKESEKEGYFGGYVQEKEICVGGYVCGNCGQVTPYEEVVERIILKCENDNCDFQEYYIPE